MCKNKENGSGSVIDTKRAMFCFKALVIIIIIIIIIIYEFSLESCSFLLWSRIHSMNLGTDH